MLPITGKKERNTEHPEGFRICIVAILFPAPGDETFHNASCMLVATVSLLLVFCMESLSRMYTCVEFVVS